MNKYTLIHTALFAEAKPLIEYFKMQCLQKKPYRIYIKNHLLLVVSGMGAKNTLHVESVLKRFCINKAINIGIAGCKDKNIEIGSLFCINHILNDINTTNITSVTKPSGHDIGLETTLVDMESSSFLNICQKVLKPEDIYIFKVVSDYLDTTIPEKKFVENLIKNSIKKWKKYV